MEPTEKRVYKITLLVKDAETLIALTGTLSSAVTSLARRKDIIMSVRAQTPKAVKPPIEGKE